MKYINSFTLPLWVVLLLMVAAAYALPKAIRALPLRTRRKLHLAGEHSDVTVSALRAERAELYYELGRLLGCPTPKTPREALAILREHTEYLTLLTDDLSRRYAYEAQQKLFGNGLIALISTMADHYRRSAAREASLLEGIKGLSEITQEHGRYGDAMFSVLFYKYMDRNADPDLINSAIIAPYHPPRELARTSHNS